ncbi:MAG: polymer-forming cytoskeletal protein [Anaerolineales bacterium]|nr:polymer-forming cytoskeletal protein [Anaerolineales bacterium]
MSKKRLLYGGGAILAGVLLMALLMMLIGCEQPDMVAQGVSHMSGPLDITGGGSVSAPALYLAGDSDTGIYQSAVDNWDLAVAGSNVLNVSATGPTWTGDQTVNGALVVTGTSDLQGNVSDSIGDFTIADDVVVTGTLNVQGAGDFDSDLNVDGGLVVDLTSDLKGDVSDSAGDFTIADNAVITGTTDFQGDISRSNATLRIADDVLITGTSDLRGNISDGAGDLTIADTLLVTNTFTVDQSAASDIADFKDSGTTTVKMPDGGGLLLNPAGSPTGAEGLLNYDNAKTSFHALEVYDGNHWRPVDPRRDLRDHTFIIHSGTAEYDSEFSWIPLFTHPDLSITMGGFWMAKYEMSQPTATRTDGDPIIADNADPGTTPAVSVPGVALWDNIQFDEARKAVQNAGSEYHLCTAEEWAAAAYWAQLAGTMPYGNNNNSSTAPGDVTIDAYDCVEGGMTDKLCGTGTGPNAFSLNYSGSGPMDLNGNAWEWMDGLYMDTSGYVYVFSDTIHIDVQVGTSTSNSGVWITDTNQSWAGSLWVGYYLQTGTVAAIEILTSTTTSIGLASGTPSGDYSIVRRIDTDITASAGASGQYILTLWDDDATLKRYAIPKTSDGTGSASYGTDGFWYDKSAFRAAIRGGHWNHGAQSGVFALGLYNAPSDASTSLSFRACRAP